MPTPKKIAPRKTVPTTRRKAASPIGKRGPAQAMENTVLLATANTELRALLGTLAIPELYVYEAKHKEDIVAIPYCLAYIDADRLDADLVTFLAEMAEDADPGFRLVVLGTTPDMPASLKAITTVAPYVWSRKIIVQQITVAMGQARGAHKRQQQFQERVYRIIQLYHELREGKVVEIDRILGRYGMTERTLRRDLKVLRDLFPDLPVIYDRKFKA